MAFMKIIIILVLILVAIFLFLTATQFPPLWSLMSPKPPRPEITYGEFPFRLEYELYGERFIVEDTVIVEYDGMGFNLGEGNYNAWKQRLASGNELVMDMTDIVLFEASDAELVCYYIGIGKYYMGDGGAAPEPYNIAILNPESGSTSGWSKDADYWFREYNLRIISWEFSDPISPYI